MENNVVSLDIARQLKAAGFPQDKTANWWFPTDFKKKTYLLQMRVTHDPSMCFAAPCAQEIADQLPKRLDVKGDDFDQTTLTIWPDGRLWRAGYLSANSHGHDGDAPTMADALANLWLKLNTNKGEDHEQPSDRHS